MIKIKSYVTCYVHSPEKPECLYFQKLPPFIPKYPLKHQYLLKTSYIQMISMISSFHQYKKFNLKLFNCLINKNWYLNILDTKLRLIIWKFNETKTVNSVNSTIFFWHAGKLRQDLYLRALILSFMESSFLTLQYFFCFFYLVCKLFKGFFRPLCQSVNCISSVFES